MGQHKQKLQKIEQRGKNRRVPRNKFLRSLGYNPININFLNKTLRIITNPNVEINFYVSKKISTFGREF